MNLVWFRSDLRVSDNSPLWNAMCSGETKACYLPPIKQWERYGWGERKIKFIQDSAAELRETLKNSNVELAVIEVDSFEQQIHEIARICQHDSIQNIFWNNEYPLDERARDDKAQKLLGLRGVNCHRYDDGLILPPGQVTTQQGEIYKVFTPFKKAWIAQVEGQPIDILPPSGPIKPDKSPPGVCISAGEAAGLNSLDQFLLRKIHFYKDDRDTPSLSGTSSISAHLSVGTISPRMCLKQATEQNNFELSTGHQGIVTWISQLVWREFYYHIIATQDRLSKHQPYKQETAKLNWNQDPDSLHRWQQGKTGVPIVDAGMRQLNTTGWMHNRVRMITAMYLTKNLLIDWRLGERYFLNQLIDADFALNNGGWQWSASTGTDAAPYFRIFNPYSQGARFDPEASYIKQFVPELSHISNAVIHNEDKLLQSRPIDYPPPTINIKQSRLRALAAFKGL